MRKQIVYSLVFILFFIFVNKVKAFYYQGVAMTCENNCAAPNDWCNPAAPSDSCCQQVKATGDPLACPWPQRGYCKDDECAAIPAGVDRQRCGAPRHHWCDLCTGSCCTNSDYSVNHIPEIPPPDFSNGCPSTIQWAAGHGGPAPTSSPKPTKVPTARPTQPANPTQPVQPTNYPSPTQIPEPTDPLAAPTHIYPTEEPAVEQQNNTTDYGFASQGFNQGNNNNGWNYSPRPIQSGISFNLPSISLPALHLQGLMINMEKVNQQASKTLDFFEYVFFRIKFFDMKLERGINGSFLKILR